MTCLKAEVLIPLLRDENVVVLFASFRTIVIDYLGRLDVWVASTEADTLTYCLIGGIPV